MKHQMTWKQVIKLLLQLGWRQDVRLCKSCMAHPTSIQGMKKHSGTPMGQSADYRLVLPDGVGLHIREYDDCWTAHLDEVDPQINVLEHLRQDSPGHYLMALGAGALALGHFLKWNQSQMNQGLLGAAVLAVMGIEKGKRDDKKRLARLQASLG